MNNRRQSDRRTSDALERIQLAHDLEVANKRIAELEIENKKLNDHIISSQKQDPIIYQVCDETNVIGFSRQISRWRFFNKSLSFIPLYELPIIPNFSPSVKKLLRLIKEKDDLIKSIKPPKLNQDE